MANLLEVRGISISFGGLKAVQDLSFCVQSGAIHALIGPNGAGKSTVLNCLSRFYDPDAGTVRYKEHDLLRLRDYEVARVGIARTFQNLELFAGMTALENVLVSRNRFMRAGVLASMARLPLTRSEERQARERAMSILEVFGLTAHANTAVRFLPYGQQKLVELARALALEPDMLLLDEPAGGMNTQEVIRLADHLKEAMRVTRATILLVEHNMSLVMSLSDSITVMNHGQLLAEGTPKEIQENEAVTEAYLGGKRRGTRVG